MALNYYKLTRLCEIVSCRPCLVLLYPPRGATNLSIYFIRAYYTRGGARAVGVHHTQPAKVTSYKILDLTAEVSSKLTFRTDKTKNA